jgi:hypothetical protein
MSIPPRGHAPAILNLWRGHAHLKKGVRLLLEEWPNKSIIQIVTLKRR